MPNIDEAKIVLEDGKTLKQWLSYSVDSDFLTPTDGWSLSVGDARLHTDETYKSLVPDSKVQIYMGESLVLTGIVDVVEFTSDTSGGTICNVRGRDIMRTLCKSNVWPGLKIKDLTLADMVSKVLETYYPESRPELYLDDKANRSVLGLKGAFTPAERSAKQKQLIDRAQAHPNEGAFEFIARQLRRHGLWIWATADGGIVISGPEYNQEPSYKIIRKRGDGTSSQWLSARYTYDRTNVPSFLQVRGKSTSKEWEKTEVFGVAADPNAHHGTLGLKWYNGVIEPAYVQHDEAKDPDQCKAFALQELTRLKADERVYTVTAIGHRDKATGNVFAVNTVAAIDDEFTGVSEKMFVKGRTFRKDSGGTTTELRCVPLGSILFSEVDYEGGDVKASSGGGKK